MPDLDADAGRGAAAWPPADPRTWDADQAVTVLYSGHYRSLVRTATFLVQPAVICQEVKKVPAAELTQFDKTIAAIESRQPRPRW